MNIFKACAGLWLCGLFGIPSLDAGVLAPDVMWTYKQASGKDLQMSAFLPDNYDAAKTFPTFVVFHGGSWRSGDANWHYPDCAYWSSRGMIAVSVDYRLKERDSVEVPLECVKDAKSAIRYLRKNAQELKVDPDKIVAAGGSAGGQLAAATAMITSEDINDNSYDLSISCKPNAVILYNPYFKCESKLSPPDHVVRGLPSFITFLGDQDTAISVDSLQAFHESLVKAGNVSEYYVGKGGKHGFCNGRNQQNPFFYWSLELADRFLVKNGVLSGTSKVQLPDGIKRIQEDGYLAFNTSTTSEQARPAQPSVVERPVVSSVERPVVSEAERPVVSSVERPVVSEAERPVVSGVERPKPNVVLLLTDDLGWQDVKCYDLDEPSPMETPNIDALAKKGVMFWQAYAPAPTCAPTRCAIMSGNHPARAQKTHVVGGGPPTPYNRAQHRMMPPWYSGRMPADEVTLAKVLQQNGYVTGHCGKWHMAIDHNAYPQPEDQGFDWTRHNLGTAARMRPHRLTGFATDIADDPYRLDEHGFTTHQNSEDALTFVRENTRSAGSGQEAKPFFLYYATWLVHTPIHTRSEQLLDKYCKKLGVERPENPEYWAGEGQTNPFYCAMVEELDYYVGKLFDYLEQTEDPRWPGHKLSENTYIIFTSDNGGMEQVPNQIITDNYPLNRGKISAMEGGTRVPLIITGPGIEAGIQSGVMVNGLDFYPTILSLTGAEKPESKHLDGCDLASLLLNNPADPSLVREADGSVRDTMTWHFPHSVAMESTIRVGDYKLVRNFDHVNNAATVELELFRLYRTKDGKQTRGDIEEAKNLAESMPEKTRELNQKLTDILTEMKASYPYYNPNYEHPLPNKAKVCTVLSHERQGSAVEFTYKENGAKVVRANLIYTTNGGERSEEWYRARARVVPGMSVSAQLPKGTTHYFVNLIDENNFLVSYPEPIDMLTKNKTRAKYSARALSATEKTAGPMNR